MSAVAVATRKDASPVSAEQNERTIRPPGGGTACVTSRPSDKVDGKTLLIKLD